MRASAGSELAARLKIAYHGADFAGWARQPGRRTVQEELEKALAILLPSAVALSVAGRTDAGVHARGQVASHEGEPAPAAALNALIGEDVRVLASEAARKGFDARRDAKSRLYRYRLATDAVLSPFELGRALYWPRPLERGLLDRCAGLLPGRHDFTAFTPTQTDHVRFERDVFRAEWLDEEDGVIAFWIEADTFMRHMVRILVGTMLAVAGRHFELDHFRALLEGRPRSEAGDTAAAHGLYLESVRY